MLRKITVLVFALLVLSVLPVFAQDMMGGMEGQHTYVKGDVADGFVTLPLHEGKLADGSEVWYIVTDVSDAEVAAQWGINYSPVLKGAEGMTRTATADGDTWTFDVGKVDFSPEHVVTPGAAPDVFPPAEAKAGSVADADYTPLVTVDGVIYNAPIVAFGVTADQINFCDGSPDYTLVHDKVGKICPSAGTVDIALSNGFAFGRQIFYISTEANVELAAALEAATLTPRLSDLSGKADAPLFLALNGATGKDNPARQGVTSALMGEGGPQNLLSAVPDFSDKYSPMWNVFIYKWTDDAINAGARTQLIDTAYQLPNFVKAGDITDPDGKALAPSGPIVNCPVIFRAQ